MDLTSDQVITGQKTFTGDVVLENCDTEKLDGHEIADFITVNGTQMLDGRKILFKKKWIRNLFRSGCFMGRGGSWLNFGSAASIFKVVSLPKLVFTKMVPLARPISTKMIPLARLILQNDTLG